MGAGKSNLVSIIISHLLNISKGGEERVAFFYINGTSWSEEAKSPETILRSLLKQLTIQGDKTLLKPVVAKYDQLRNVSSLGKEDCINLLAGIIREYQQTDIIIDGLDELKDDDARIELMKSLKQITEESQGAVVKLFISSRDHAFIGKIMDEVWVSRNEILISGKNREDIETFIKNRIEKFRSMLLEPILDDIWNDMELTLKERSNGMFLWVHLSLKSLLKVKEKNPYKFVEYLKSVPLDLKKLTQDYTILYFMDQTVKMRLPFIGF